MQHGIENPALDALSIKRACLDLIGVLFDELDECCDKSRQNSLCNCMNMALDILEIAS